MTNEMYEQLKNAIIHGDESEALKRIREAVGEGRDPLEIIDHGLQPGLDFIGQEYETGSCFVPELIVAGRIMQASMRILDNELRKRAQPSPSLGRIVLGTVAGDVHTIGKDLVGTMLSLNGFEVIDMGFNVPTSTFVEKVQASGASILALSALLTTTRQVQREIVQAVRNANLRKHVKIVIGGASTSQSWADQIGADAYGSNAVQAVAVCKQLLGVNQVS